MLNIPSLCKNQANLPLRYCALSFLVVFNVPVGHLSSVRLTDTHRIFFSIDK